MELIRVACRAGGTLRGVPPEADRSWIHQKWYDLSQEACGRTCSLAVIVVADQHEDRREAYQVYCPDIEEAATWGDTCDDALRRINQSCPPWSDSGSNGVFPYPTR
jgi:hypothetical protein